MPDPLETFWSQVQEVYESEIKPEAADIVKEALFATYPPWVAALIGKAMQNRGVEFLGNLWSSGRRRLARGMGPEHVAALQLTLTGRQPNESSQQQHQQSDVSKP
jgi:hypothetical protein